MNELVKIETNENLEPIISGRELHEKLGVNSHYKDWIKRMLDYGFVENTDYIMVAQKRASNELKGFTEYNDHILKLDTAKEICMLQRNEKGKQFRKYFIAVEKEYNSPEKVMARALLFANKKVNLLDVKVKELENKIEEDKPRTEFARTIENAKSGILFREFSKILGNENIKLGEKKLYQLFRDWNYILKGSTEPTQRAVEMGLFNVDERIIKSTNGDFINKTTKITGKGQVFLMAKIKKSLGIEPIERKEVN